VAFRRDPAWLPTRARLGASYDVPFGDVTVTLAGDAFYYFYSRGYGAQAGAEVQVGQLVQFRAGYDVLATANHLNFGMGLRPGRFRMDYAFAPLRHDLGSAHRFSVGLGL
jgi:hypothetical protein